MWGIQCSDTYCGECTICLCLLVYCLRVRDEAINSPYVVLNKTSLIKATAAANEPSGHR